jgi:hypothetical protein
MGVDETTNEPGLPAASAAPSQPAAPVVLEYSGPRPPPPWSFRPANFIIVPFSLGMASGTTFSILVVESGESQMLDLAGLAGMAGVFLIILAPTAVVCWLVVGIRQAFSRSLLLARPTRTCVWVGAVFGAVYPVMMWIALRLVAPNAFLRATWFWMVVVLGPVVACVALLKPATSRE